MKKLAWILAFPVLVSVLGRAQSAPPVSGPTDAATQERMFFPRDTFWGWAQFDLAPPHNEIDPNLCAGNAGQYGGVNAPYIWASTPTETTSWQMFDRMLGEANVVITPGSGFGAMGEGWFRISAFNSRENAEEVARRIKAIGW